MVAESYQSRLTLARDAVVLEISTLLISDLCLAGTTYMLAKLVVKALPSVLFLVAIYYVRSKNSKVPTIVFVPVKVRAANVMTSLTPASVLPSCKSQLYSVLFAAALAD